MNKSGPKTISKETQDAIKKFLTSNVSIRSVSPSTPTRIDLNFSRFLQKKREEQLEASRQRLFDTTSSKGDTLIDITNSERKNERIESPMVKRKIVPELENSMMFCKVNKSWHDLSAGDDSFLALERQCNMEDKRDRILNANDTLLFDVEPPSELWNQSINQSIAISHGMLEKVQEEDEDEDKTYEEEVKTDEEDTIEISPVKYIGLTRPSTIIEETSSQMESSSKTTICSNNSSANSSATKSTLYATASTNDSNQDLSNKSCDTSDGNNSVTKDVTPLRQQNSQIKKVERQRRGTFAFKRANYTFFPNDNLDSISECTQSFSENDEPETPKKDLLDLENSPKTPSTPDHFNNTLERVDYLLEKGKQIVEETPAAKRTSHQQSFLETPLFSCKRKRLLSEMASIEMLPLPKRGPLIDFSTPEVTNQSRVSKFSGK